MEGAKSGKYTATIDVRLSGNVPPSTSSGSITIYEVSHLFIIMSLILSSMVLFRQDETVEIDMSPYFDDLDGGASRPHYSFFGLLLIIDRC